MIIYIKSHCIPQSADHLNDITIPHENIPKSIAPHTQSQSRHYYMKIPKAIAPHPQSQSRHYHMKIPKAIAPHPQSPTTECTSWMALMYHDQPGGLLAWGATLPLKCCDDHHHCLTDIVVMIIRNKVMVITRPVSFFYRSLNRQRYSNQNRPPIKITKPIQSTLYPFTHFIWKFYLN